MLPLLVLYCHVPPPSRPMTFTVPTLVMPSLLLLPLSVARPSPGATGARVSTLMLRVPAPLGLPAVSTAVADRISAPWPMATISAAVRV